MTTPLITMDVGSVRGQVEKIGRVFDAALATAIVATKEAMTEITNDAVAEAQQAVIDRTAALNVAQAGDLDFTNKVWAAKIDLLAAQNGVKDAQVNAASQAIKLSDAMFNQAVVVGANAEAVDKLRGNLGLLAAQYPQLAGTLGAMLGGGGSTFPAFGAVGGGDWASPRGPIPRAHGGPTNAGGTYLVGENGPELLHMGGRSGYVQANGGSGGSSITVIMPPGSDGDDVVAALTRWQRRNGPVPISTR